MKKAVVLGMILLALGTFAYADGGATVGMDFGRTQFNIANGQTGSGANTAINQGWTGPEGLFPTGERIDFQFAWSNQYTGINATFYIGNGYGTPAAGYPNLFVQNLYGTLKLVPDMFTAYIGEFQGDGWDHFRLDSNHPIHDVNNSNVGRFGGWGAILDLMPKDTGFELAVFAKLAAPTATTSYLDYTIQQQLTNYAVAASYTMPNLVKVMAGTNTFATFSGKGGSSERNVFASVQLLMIPNLTLWDEFYIAGFDIDPNPYTIYSDELAAQYVMDKLTIVLAAFFGGNSAGGSPDYPGAKSLRFLSGGDYTAWAVSPEVYYNVGVATVGLYGNVAGTSISNSGIAYAVEPYVKLNNFGLRLSFLYSGSSATGAISTWEVPVLIDWGF